MMQELMSDALANLVRKKAASDPLTRLQGLNYPWNFAATAPYKDGAVFQSADISPKHFWVTFKEIIKYHMYNVSNVTAYVTIIKKYPKRSSRETGYGAWQTTLAMFPVADTQTPLSLTAATAGGHLIKTNSLLAWGYPDSMNTGGSSPTIGSGIDPFRPSTGANTGSLMIPRQWGAFEYFFPVDPWPSFYQNTAMNHFNVGPTNIAGNHDALAGMVYYDLPLNTSYSRANIMAIDEMTTKTAGSGGDPIYYRPTVGSNYFRNLQITPGSTSTGGGTGDVGTAYGTVNTLGTYPYSSPTYDTLLGDPPRQRQFMDGSNLDNTSSTAIVGQFVQSDPFAFAGGDGSGQNWSAHPQYDEMKNRCMRLLFKMYKKRVTIPPGKVLRWNLRSKRVTINPVRDNLVTYQSTTSAPAVWSSQQGDDVTIDGWGANTAPSQSYAGNGGQLQCPSMWGPEWPCRTVVWSMSLRGQTAVSTNSNKAQIMPTELLLKKDHTIRYAVKYRPVTPQLKRKSTIRNYMEHAPSLTNYRIQYPIAGTIAGGSADTTAAQAKAITTN